MQNYRKTKKMAIKLCANIAILTCILAAVPLIHSRAFAACTPSTNSPLLGTTKTYDDTSGCGKSCSGGGCQRETGNGTMQICSGRAFYQGCIWLQVTDTVSYQPCSCASCTKCSTSTCTPAVIVKKLYWEGFSC